MKSRARHLFTAFLFLLAIAAATAASAVSALANQRFVRSS